MDVFDETDYSRFRGHEKRLIEELMLRLMTTLKGISSPNSIALKATGVLSNYVEYQTRESPHLVRHGYLGDPHDEHVRIYFRTLHGDRNGVVLVDLNADHDIQAAVNQIRDDYQLSPYYKRDDP